VPKEEKCQQRAGGSLSWRQTQERRRVRKDEAWAEGQMKERTRERRHLARGVVFSSVKKFGVAAVDETILLHTMSVQVDVQDWQRHSTMSYSALWNTQRLWYGTRFRSRILIAKRQANPPCQTIPNRFQSCF
jgi:hypothetical protein